jgi:hypothetical protein
MKRNIGKARKEDTGMKGIEDKNKEMTKMN